MALRAHPTGTLAAERVIAVLGVRDSGRWVPAEGGWTPTLLAPTALSDRPGVVSSVGSLVAAGASADDRGAWWTGAPHPDLGGPAAGAMPDDLLWSPPPEDPADGSPPVLRFAPGAPGLTALTPSTVTDAEFQGRDAPGPLAVEAPATRADPLPSTSRDVPAPLDGFVGDPPTSLVAMLRSGRLDPGRRGAMALALLGVVAAAISAVVLLRARPAEQPISAPPVAGASTASEGPQLVVDVAGKIRRPGLVRVPMGSRIDDVIKAAGGTLPGGSTAALNLARKVVDGEQVLVGVAPVPGVGGAALSHPAGGAAALSGGVLDLNLAGLKDFEALPGIGPVLADRMLSWRTEHGGRFASIDQLREVSGIGESKYQALASKVRV